MLSMERDERRDICLVSASDILTAKEVADMLRVSVRTIIRLAENGELPGFTVGKQWRFYRSDVQTYIDHRLRRSQEKQD
jgi:excisionase family DNA binding protein